MLNLQKSARQHVFVITCDINDKKILLLLETNIRFLVITTYCTGVCAQTHQMAKPLAQKQRTSHASEIITDKRQHRVKHFDRHKKEPVAHPS